MKTYQNVQSTVEPLEVEITESRVFVASNVTPVNEPGTEDNPGFVGFQFDLLEYTKDEYIKLQADMNKALEASLTETQLALCEVYEMIGG